MIPYSKVTDVALAPCMRKQMGVRESLAHCVASLFTAGVGVDFAQLARGSGHLELATLPFKRSAGASAVRLTLPQTKAAPREPAKLPSGCMAEVQGPT